MANFCVDSDAYQAAESIRFDALKTAALIKQGVAVAQFALNASDVISNFRKLRNVTSRGIAIEEEQQGHMRDVFWPAETQMLNEFTQKTVWEGQAVLAKRYAGRMWAPLAAGFAKEIRLLECNKPRYCTNAHVKRLQELMVQRSAVRANVTLLADRIAFFEIQAVDDTDYERRKQAIAMRQGLVQQAASLMQTAARGFAGARSNAMGAVNNAISAFGHAWGERNNADNRIGRDPYFHSQVSRTAQEASVDLTMGPLQNPPPVDTSGWGPFRSSYPTAPYSSTTGPEKTDTSYWSEATNDITISPVDINRPDTSQTVSHD